MLCPSFTCLSSLVIHTPWHRISLEQAEQVFQPKSAWDNPSLKTSLTITRSNVQPPSHLSQSTKPHPPPPLPPRTHLHTTFKAATSLPSSKNPPNLDRTPLILQAKQRLPFPTPPLQLLPPQPPQKPNPRPSTHRLLTSPSIPPTIHPPPHQTSFPGLLSTPPPPKNTRASSCGHT